MKPTEDEQGVEQTRGDHLVDLGVGELKLLQQIDEEHTDTAVYIKDQIALLLSLFLSITLTRWTL